MEKVGRLRHGNKIYGRVFFEKKTSLLYQCHSIPIYMIYHHKTIPEPALEQMNTACFWAPLVSQAAICQAGRRQSTVDLGTYLGT